jgi:hypothetical protein
MVATIQNQQSGITHLVVINGEEITEHGRLFSSSMATSASNVELLNGNKKRFIKNAKNVYTLSFQYLPDHPERTIDGRKARNYLLSVAKTSSSASLSITLDPAEPSYNTVVYVDSYSETLVRRDIPNQCAYYNVEISLKEK